MLIFLHKPALAVAFWSSIQGVAESVAMNPALPIPEPGWIVAMLSAEYK